MRSRVAPIVAMVVALSSAGAFAEDWGDDYQPDPGTYEEALSPYGSWVEDGGYGRVWQPAVRVGWRPYVGGYWGWGASGWTWISFEPFGWTFHYGRWGLSPVFGWVWVPGFIWGPAWVNWSWSGGYVGWAPIAPFGGVPPYSSFVFVRQNAFCHSNLGSVVLSGNRVPRHLLVERGGGSQRPPDVHQIAHASGGRVRRVDGRPADTVAPWVRSRHRARPALSGQPRPGHGAPLPGRAPSRGGHASRPRVDGDHARSDRGNRPSWSQVTRPARPLPPGWRSSGVTRPPVVLRGQGDRPPIQPGSRGSVAAHGGTSSGGARLGQARPAARSSVDSRGRDRTPAPHSGLHDGLRGGATFR